MTWLARQLARNLWWMMLWLMRRPRMRRFQRWTVSLLPVSKHESARQSIRRQNAFALKYGLLILVILMNFILAMLAVSILFSLALWLYDSGALSVPDSRVEG